MSSSTPIDINAVEVPSRTSWVKFIPGSAAVRQPMLRYSVLRGVIGVLTLIAVSVLVFFGTNLLPGNAAQVQLGALASNPELLARVMAEMGLDRPPLVRYFEWVTGLLHGDLGVSMVTGQPVEELVGPRLLNTLTLAVCLLLLLAPIALVLGTWAAVTQEGGVDRSISTTALWLLSTPEFVVGTFVVLVFSSWLGVLPSVSILNPNLPAAAQPQLLVLPVLTMLLVGVGQLTRMIRASTIDVLRSDFVEMAVLRGVANGTLLMRHVLPNSIGPSIQVLGLSLGALIGGVVVTEAVFSYPGLGTLLVQSVAVRDITTVASLTMIISAAYIVSNIASDVIVVALNPRLRRGGAL